MDEVFVFTLACGQCLALQVAKDVQIYGMAPPLLLSLVLAAAIVWSHLSSSESALLSLAASALVVLGAHGSQSNHVLLEAIVMLAVLLTAPAPPWLSRGGSITQGDEERRREWSTRLTLAMRTVLCALYAVTGFAKLNDAWHDPHRSCCVQMFVGLWAMFADVQLLPPLMLRLIPYLATAFELGFALALLPILVLEATAWRPNRLLRVLAVLGAGFHACIALPPPPISVYPFSMLMVPIYVSSLIPHEARWAALSVSTWAHHTHALVAAVVSIAVAVAFYSTRAGRYFEYPPYFSWELGVLWVLGAFGSLATVAVAAPAAALAEVATPVARQGLVRMSLALFPAACILAIGSSTYLSVRTYPSFAMFSNLLIEGGASNHWLVRAPEAWAGLVPREYGPHDAIEILETDLPSLRHLQINLAPLLPVGVLDAFRLANVSAEFHITPPAWGYAPTEPFRPFAVPVVEVRRRLSVASQSRRDYFLRFREAGVHAMHAVGAIHEHRRRGGVLMAGSNASLEQPLPSFRAWLHRYRTFDLGYSPCRH